VVYVTVDFVMSLFCLSVLILSARCCANIVMHVVSDVVGWLVGPAEFGLMNKMA